MRDLANAARASGNDADAAVLDEVLEERAKMIEWLHEVVIRLGRHPKLASDRDPSDFGLIPTIQDFLGIADKVT